MAKQKKKAIKDPEKEKMRKEGKAWVDDHEDFDFGGLKGPHDFKKQLGCGG